MTNLEREKRQLIEKIEGKVKHTPGPWTISIDHVGMETYIHGPKGNALAQMRSCNDGDASLMAAAPDLLEALKAVRLSLSGTTIYHVALLEVDKAIAKAEGR